MPFGRAKAIVVALPSLTHHEKTACEIRYVGEITFLRARRTHRYRFPLFVQGLKDTDDGPVFWISALAWAIRVVKVGYRVRQIEPVAVIADELGIGCLHPCVGAAVATHAAVGKF